MISWPAIASLTKLVARLQPALKLAKWLPVAGPIGAAVVPIATAVAEAVAAAIRIVVAGVTAVMAHPATLSVVAIAVVYGWTLGHGDAADQRKPLEAQLKQCREEVAALRKTKKPGAQSPKLKWGF